MTSHRFDPVSAALGVIAVALGLVVATGSTHQVADDGGWWLALAVLAVGLGVAGSALRSLAGDDLDPPTE